MALTIFENLPSTNTPITAENLNNNFSYTTPIGGIQAYAGSIAPNGYLLCDGQEVSRITYAELYALIGTTYGAGDGSTTFNVPNLKGKVIVGYDSTQTEFNDYGKTGGEKTHLLTANEIPSVDKNGNTLKYNPYFVPDNGSGRAVAQFMDGNALYGGQAHNNLQPYITLNYIIKY